MLKFTVLALVLPLVFSSDVIPLKKTTRDELAKYPIALVKYYVPWCGHCKALAPHFEEAAAELKKREPVVPLFEVNCEEEADMCGEVEIRGYPTLKVYNYGEYTEDFDGARTRAAIVDFMSIRSGPPATEIFDASHYEDVLASDAYTVVIQSKNSEALEEFEKVARKFRKFLNFVYTKANLLDPSDGSLIKLLQPKQLETKMENRIKTYDGPIKSLDIEKWIRNNAVGFAGIRDKKIQEFFRKPLLVVYTRVDFERDPSHIRYLRNRLISIAKENISKLQFALSDTTAYAGELYELAITPKDGDIVVVIMAEDGKNYVMSEKFSVQSLKNFVNEFIAGSLEPYVKSEPVPEKQDDPVMKVVGKTFENIVYDTSKDVLIEFYAPWCGHCKALKPKYEELAKKLSKENNIVIAAIDATANSFPSTFSVHGYPTIYWVSRNSKDKPVAYEGNREVADMLKFVAKSATDELSQYTRDGQPKQEEL